MSSNRTRSESASRSSCKVLSCDSKFGLAVLPAFSSSSCLANCAFSSLILRNASAAFVDLIVSGISESASVEFGTSAAACFFEEPNKRSMSFSDLLAPLAGLVVSDAGGVAAFLGSSVTGVDTPSSASAPMRLNASRIELPKSGCDAGLVSGEFSGTSIIC